MLLAIITREKDAAHIQRSRHLHDLLTFVTFYERLERFTQIMHFNDYQRESRKTAGYPPIGHGVIYPTLGLTNEAGEVAGKIKKIFRDKAGVIGEAEREALQAELGDVLWYLAQVCTELGLSLDDVAQGNLDKLTSRQQRGMIGGDGDTR